MPSQALPLNVNIVQEHFIERNACQVRLIGIKHLGLFDN